MDVVAAHRARRELDKTVGESTAAARFVEFPIGALGWLSERFADRSGFASSKWRGASVEFPGKVVVMNPSSSPNDGSDRRTVAPDRAIEIPAPDGVRMDPFAWWTLATTDRDALIVGESRSVSRILSLAWPTLRKPVFFCERRLDVADRAAGDARPSGRPRARGQ